MNFGESVKSVFSQYATFSGRASRSEFWWFFLFLFLVNIVARLVDGALQASVGRSGIGTLFGLAVLLPYLAVTVRRLHDSGRSGWWLLGLVLAYLAGAVALVVGIIGGVISGLANGSDVRSSGGGLTVGLVVLAVVGGLVLLGTLVVWIVQLTRPSTPGPNAYGLHPLDPARFPGSVDAPAPYNAALPDAYGPPGPSPWGPQQPPST